MNIQESKLFVDGNFLARNWPALFVTKGAQIFFDWSVDDSSGVDGMSVRIFWR